MKYQYIESLKETETTCIFCNWSEKPPKYTITIPTYKRKELLQYAIESALNQKSFSDYEILVLDNNPIRNDEGELVMKQFMHTPHIAYYKNQENLGIINNLNKLGLIARTEWLVMLHSDDMLYPDFLLNVNKIVKEMNPSAIFTEDMIVRTSDDYKPIRDSNQKIKLTKLKRGDYMLWNVGCNPVGLTARRLSILELGGYDPIYGSAGDMNLNYKLATIGQTFLLRGYPLTCYRWMDNETLKRGVIEDITRNAAKIRINILSEILPILPQRIVLQVIRYQEAKELLALKGAKIASINSKEKLIRCLCHIIRFFLNFRRKWRFMSAKQIKHL